MKKYLWLNAGCGILIGIASAVAVQAADLKDALGQIRQGPPVTASQPQSPTRSEAAPGRQQDGQFTPKGAQGPIRTELGDKPAEAGREAVYRDLQKGLYPMTHGAGIP